MDQLQSPPAPCKPRQQAQPRHHRRRYRPRRRLRRLHTRRNGLQRIQLLHSGQPPPRALHRRTGRYQRCQELSERRRLRIPPLLRHCQRRRLPLSRSQRVPSCRSFQQHHRPVRAAGRSLRPRIRRPPRQPFFRRRSGKPYILRQRPDRPAAPAGRLQLAQPPD